jgi:hypothetical protein
MRSSSQGSKMIRRPTSKTLGGILAAALFAILTASSAFAQCAANLPANSVMGRLAFPAGGGSCQAIPFQQFANALFSASTVTLPTLRVIATNPTLSTVDYGFSTSKKAVAFSTTATGTGSVIGAGGISQLRVTSTATDIGGAAAWTMQTRIEAPNESYAGAAILDNQNASAFGAAFAAILRNGVGNTAYDNSPGSVAGMNGVISFSEQDIGQGQNAYVATNSITATNRWHVAFKAINPSDAVIRADQFGSAAVLDFRRLNAAPPSSTGLLTGDVIYAINGYGWGTNTGSTAPRVAIEARASQNWTDAAQGSSAFVRATRAGTITTNDVVRFGGDIPLSVLQIAGDNAGQSLRLVPAYDVTKFWDIWTGTSGGLTFGNSVGNQLGIDTVGTLFPTGFIDLAAGRVLATNIAAPASPAAGRSSIYVDSTSLALVNKDGNGTVHTTVTPDVGAANNFLTGIGSAGAITKAQPSAANLSNGTTGSGAVVLGTTPTIATPVINGLPTGTGVASANTASTLVARDGSGNFSAGTITAALTGNATTATSATTATTATNATNAAITDDTSTNATMNLAWVTSNTGNLPVKTTSTKLNFNPSTGALTATRGTSKTTLVLQVNLSANQTPAAGSFVKIQLNYKTADPNSWFDNVTNFRFQPNVAGVFSVTGSVNTAVGAASYGGIAIYKNGTEYNKYILPSTAADAMQLTVPALVELNGSTDYIELFGFSSGGTPLFTAGTQITKLNVYQLY